MLLGWLLLTHMSLPSKLGVPEGPELHDDNMNSLFHDFRSQSMDGPDSRLPTPESRLPTPDQCRSERIHGNKGFRDI